ncbi:MAG: AbiJ-NTD4 domain-containing protein [Fusobacteriaceae bacterium]
MELYSERHGVRRIITKTETINRDVYEILFKCCEKYEKNLTHIFSRKAYNDFTNSSYTEFDKEMFMIRLKIKIPNLFQNEYSSIAIPTIENKYDKYALLDYIEFFAKNIMDISEEWNNEKYKNFKNINCLKTDQIFINFENEINQIFIEAGLLYKLTNKKIIERVIENTPLTDEIEKSFENISEIGLKHLLEDAITLHRGIKPIEREYSVRKIWDALERLKTYYSELNKKDSIKKIVDEMSNRDLNFIEIFNDEFIKLTCIGNKFRIRHHETDKIDITDLKYYDYFFNRCLSLISLAIQYLK